MPAPSLCSTPIKLIEHAPENRWKMNATERGGFFDHINRTLVSPLSWQPQPVVEKWTIREHIALFVAIFLMILFMFLRQIIANRYLRRRMKRNVERPVAYHDNLAFIAVKE